MHNNLIIIAKQLICNEEMQEGGIVAHGVAVSWFDKVNFEKTKVCYEDRKKSWPNKLFIRCYTY